MRANKGVRRIAIRRVVILADLRNLTRLRSCIVTNSVPAKS
ncbi:MAG: hypothetical protein ACT4P6_13100 [Gemmatimonadaceae bacterium]